MSRHPPDNPGSDIEALYRQHGSAIRRHVERQFGDGPPDPEDAVHAAFERFARLEPSHGVADPGAFLRRSAHNFVIDYRRAQKVRGIHARSAVALEPVLDDLTAERVLSAKERLAILDQTIRQMDERRRNVLIMNRIHGMNCAAIARTLQCSPTLVKIRLAEAVALCQQALRTADGEE